MSRASRAAVLAAALVLAGCGYRFSVGGSGLPPDTGKIHVPVFENRSGEPEAGAIFAAALGDSLAARGLLGGTGSPSRIEGVVTTVGAKPQLPHATRPTSPSPSLYAVEAEVRLTLVVDGKVACSREFRARESYLPAVDLLGLETNRGEALRRLAASMMGGAENRLCD
jgi:hypothetical protein